MPVRYILLFVVFLAGCNSGSNYKRHKRLISFNMRYYKEPENIDIKILNAISDEKFHPKTDTIKYLKGRIYISCLALLNGCGEYKGAIRFSGDSLFVDVENVSDVACTSETCERLVFMIENKENKRYKIVKGR